MSMLIDEKYIHGLTGFKVKTVKSCSSAFDELGAEDVVIAFSQRNGAGRGDHTFASPPGGLYIVMREVGLNFDAHTLTPSVGLAVRDSIKAILGIDTRLKWVNDVMLGGKKVCGILCRSPRRGEYHIGIGINYATDIEALKAAGLDAATLNADKKKATEFLADVIRRVHVYCMKPFDHERYNAFCETIDKTVSFTQNGMQITGYAQSVDTDGTLLVRIGMATVAVDSGEVSEIREVKAE